jgi:DNA mismatch repair protein MutS2
LEWDKLLEFLSQEAESKRGKDLCRQVLPGRERAIVNVLLAESDEALALINQRTGMSFERLPELDETLNRLDSQAVLSESELHFCRSTMTLSRQSKRSLSLLDNEAFPSLRAYLPALALFDQLLGELNEMLDESGKVKDDATPHLRGLKSEVRRLDSKIKDELNKVIHSQTQSKALQEPIYTQRNGRYVLPVNAAQRHVVPGIVHDSSQSGLTVYVEPMPVVELANKLRIKEAEIEHEIARILATLSQLVYAGRDELSQSYVALSELDAIFARARFATKYDGIKPELNDENRFEFINARHPLLILQSGKEKVVPNTVSLGGKERTLVITGPNTGGKTVLLKTIGLLSMMVRTGLLIPVSRGSKAALFTEIFADIGDEQSLAQSLSTFSSHMTTIVDVVRSASVGTLALLDEIGVGTDPREGAAIARSVLEHLNDSGAVTVSTTHFGQLKTLAYNLPGMVNGSLEFDEATLSPTYRLRTGIPGSSKGITIARRLGLDEKLVELAISYLDVADTVIDETVARLEERIKGLESKEALAQEKLSEAERLSQELQAEIDREREQSEETRQKLAAALKEEFTVAFELIKDTIRNLQKEPSISGAQKAKEKMEQLKKELNWLDAPVKKGAEAAPVKFKVGDRVSVVSLNQKGVIEELPEGIESNPRGIVVVRAGAVKLKVPVSDIKRISDGGGKAEKGSGGSVHKGRATTPGRVYRNETDVFVRTDRNTLDLRGERVDAALIKLEQFLDACLLSSVSPVMIIHGHGTGAVKEAVRQFLSNSNYVSKFRPGETYEGADGVTVAEL